MDVYPCATDKISTGFFAGLDINGYAVCHPFVASYTADVGSIKFWLKQHPDSANLPAEVIVYIYNTDNDGLPIGSAICSATVAVPGALTTTGEELTGTLSATFEMIKGQNYGIGYWFAVEASAYSIVIAGGELDTCPWTSGGNSIPWVKAEASTWVWENPGGLTCVPSYYKLVPAALDLQVYTNAATVVTKNSATLNGTIGYIPTGKSVTRRGFRYGTDENLDTYTEWSETGSFEVGAFSYALTGLSSGVTYYFQAFACVTEETLGPTRCYADNHWFDISKYGYSIADTPPDSIWKNNPAKYSYIRVSDVDEVTLYKRATFEWWIIRSICRFNTSAIPVNAVITKATLHIKVITVYPRENLYLVTFPQVSAWNASTIKANYWSEFVDGSYGDIALVIPDDYDSWTVIDVDLNAVGYNHINRGGWTYFGWMRADDYGRESKEIGGGSGWQFANASYGGTGIAYIDIEYTV